MGAEDFYELVIVEDIDDECPSLGTGFNVGGGLPATGEVESLDRKRERTVFPGALSPFPGSRHPVSGREPTPGLANAD